MELLDILTLPYKLLTDIWNKIYIFLIFKETYIRMIIFANDLAKTNLFPRTVSSAYCKFLNQTESNILQFVEKCNNKLLTYRRNLLMESLKCTA
jgi:hypothetical protein